MVNYAPGQLCPWSTMPLVNRHYWAAHLGQHYSGFVKVLHWAADHHGFHRGGDLLNAGGEVRVFMIPCHSH